MRASIVFKTLLLVIEYTSFALCFLYWVFYSLVRTKGVPIFFNGIEIDSTFHGILVSIVLLFNSLFFSRLLLEVNSNGNSLRANCVRHLSKNILPVSLIFLIITFYAGGRFDYASYKLQWNIIVTGGNPWGIVEGGMINAYGYIFNFLGPLYSLNHLLPKLTFVLLLICFSLRMGSLSNRKFWSLPFLLCVNPFTVSTLAIYGFIDGLCSLLMGFALLEVSQASLRSSFRSGIFLALSILTKFYSLVALPIFLFGHLGKKLSRSFAKGFVYSSVFFVAVSYLMWGDSIVAPLFFAKGRDPSFLTIWKYVSFPELRSVVFSIISIAAIIVACARKALPLSLRTAAVLSIVFGSYYLGHQQFYLGILVCLSVYIVEAARYPSIQLKVTTLRTFALMFGWFIFIQTGFELFDEYKPAGLQSLLPFFSYLNSIILIGSGIYWLSCMPTLEEKSI